MKKFSTIALLVALSTPAFSMDEMHPPTTNCAFLDKAPDQHLVVKGDTLWGISQLFLEHAWCWPQVWGLNREEIKNPHWIYPGQIVYLDRTNGRLKLGEPLGQGSNDGVPTVKLSPQIRSSNIESNAIRSIPANVIEPFLSQPIVLEEAEIKNAPRIVAAQEGHVNVGRSEKAYVMGDIQNNTDFQVYRPAQPLKDPVTNKVIGYEYAYLGTISLIRKAKLENEAHSFRVTSSKEEMTVGNLLLPTPISELTNYAPHAPSTRIDARVVSIYRGIKQAGQNQTIALNVGTKDGVDNGTVLQLFRLGKTIADRTNDKKEVKLPDEEYGTVFIYRVFKNVSYGLIMQVSDSAQIGDIAKTPE